MNYALIFNIDNNFNKCPEFTGWITASLPLKEKLNRIILNLHHKSVGNLRKGGYCIRDKTYYAKLLIDTRSDHFNQDVFLEKLIPKVNTYASKITQEMHKLDFTSISADCYSYFYYLSNPCGKAASFKKLLNYGTSNFETGYATEAEA